MLPSASVFTSCFFQLFGAFFFLITSFYVLEDKAKADAAIAGQEEDDDSENAPIVRNMENNDISSSRPQDSDFLEG